MRFPRTRNLAVTALSLLAVLSGEVRAQQPKPFDIMETTVDQIHAAFAAKTLTARQLVQAYLDRIAAYDQAGPKINCVISLNPNALAEADRLDAAYEKTGKTGLLHGIPVLVKDQIDTAGMPTTLGSVVFADYRPPKDAFIVTRLREAGAIILGKTTLGEMGGGDTYGSLFGATRNPYDLTRTVGGSSGGSAGCLAANFSTLALGEESASSIRRPAAWNAIFGMRPTAGLVSRTGSFAGYPTTIGSLGPMARTARDMALMLDVIAGYDPEDPVTALGVGHKPNSYTDLLVENGLKGARIGVLREPIGMNPDPESEDFAKVDAVFQRAVGQIRDAGAVVVDPIVVPDLKELLARHAGTGHELALRLKVWLGRNPSSPFKSLEDIKKSPLIDKIIPAPKAAEWKKPHQPDMAAHAAALYARERLMVSIMNVMAEHNLDAIVYKSVEHQPGVIEAALKPPYPNARGVNVLNTFLVYAATIAVPAGLTSDGIPAGITFFGRPYSEPLLFKLAYGYEQAVRPRTVPSSTPALR